MLDRARVGLAVLTALALLSLAPNAFGHGRKEHMLRVRVPVPAAGDVSVATFQMRIGAEGHRHRKQRLLLKLVNRRRAGVFALARLRPEPAHPGRFLGVVEVIHRGTASAALLPASLGQMASAPPFEPARAAAGVLDEFLIGAENERFVGEVIKSNVIRLAEDHELGMDELCNPDSPDTYLLGSEVLDEAFQEAGLLRSLLPTNMSTAELADAVLEELCSEEEPDLGGPQMVVLAKLRIGRMLVYLDRPAIKRVVPTGPGAPAVPAVGFSGRWAFEGPGEVKLTGEFTSFGTAPAQPISGIRVIIPAAGATRRQVINEICPTQLPNGTVMTTNSANDTLDCRGGSLATGLSFQVNVQTSPPPTVGMGAVLIAEEGSVSLPAFTVGGP